MKKIKLVIFEALFIILSLLISQQAFALKCIDGPPKNKDFDVFSENTSHFSSTPKKLKFIDFKDSDVVVWQADYVVQLTCYDDRATNATENVYFWFDDEFSSLFKATKSTNVILGVIYEGQERYIDSKKVKSLDTGFKGIKESTSKEAMLANCKRMKLSEATTCSDPQTLTLAYSLIIKSRKTTESYDNLSGNTSYQIFQIDGIGGRNDKGNFTETLEFGEIVYIDCLPETITKNLDLGVFPRSSPFNVILGKTKFDITIKVSGKDCAKETFKLRWIPSGKINDSTIKTNIDKVGIQIFAAGEENPYEYGAGKTGNKVFFEETTGNSISKDFEAGVIFIPKPNDDGPPDDGPPETGNFRGSANFVLTVK